MIHYSKFSIALIILALVACGKKEGVLSTDVKLDHVVATEARFHESEQVFDLSDYESERWNWDGKKVYRIDYRGEAQYSENIFFDGKKIIRTTVPAYSLQSEFEYDGRKLAKIDIYKDDNLNATMSFIHDDDNLLSEIVCRYTSAAGKEIWNYCSPLPLRQALGNELSTMIMTDAADHMLHSSSSTKAGKEIHYRLTWDADNNNVTKIAVSGSIEKPYSIDLSYDNKTNPYNQLFVYHEMNEPLFGFKMLSANNVTSIRMPYRNYGTMSFKYSYNYDGEYPSSQKLSYSYRTLVEANTDSVTVRIEKNEKYFYKK